VNANRAGSPTIKPPKEKKVTVKARINKETAPSDAVCPGGTITVTRVVNGVPGASQVVSGLTFVPGRGGQGDSLLFDFSADCPSSNDATVEFRAVARAPGATDSAPNSGKPKTLVCPEPAP
jgi:hypothetical protein